VGVYQNTRAAAPFFASYRAGHLMAGHSKWANIKHRRRGGCEARQDLHPAHQGNHRRRALGGADPVQPAPAPGRRQGAGAEHAEGQHRARDQARHGRARGRDYEEIRYEGYGIGGAAVMVDCLTDNRTRTVAEVRHAPSPSTAAISAPTARSPSSSSTAGSSCSRPAPTRTSVMEAALEAGAEDVVTNDDGSDRGDHAPGDFRGEGGAREGRASSPSSPRSR
jgi:hypothetical protein